LADTTPVVSVRSRPDGLPIETVGSPTSDGAGAAELERMQVEAFGLDAEECQVGLLVLAEHPCGHGLVVGEGDADVGGARDDVGVREQPALPVDHETGRAGDVAVALGEVQRRGAGLQRAGADEDHAGRVALVDLARAQHATQRCGGLGDRRRATDGWSDGPGHAVTRGARAEQRGGGHSAADEAGGEHREEAVLHHGSASRGRVNGK
jgi:hypothetical protein